MMWKRRTIRTTAMSTAAPATGAPSGTRDEWSDIRTRARVVHALACAGADVTELSRLAANDPAVVMAAIVYDGGHPRDYSIVTRGEVVARLRDLMDAVAWGTRAMSAAVDAAPLAVASAA